MNLENITETEELENLLEEIHHKLIVTKEKDNCEPVTPSFEEKIALNESYWGIGEPITIGRIDSLTNNIDEIGLASGIQNQIQEGVQELQFDILENQNNQAINPIYVGKIKPINSTWIVTESILLSPIYNKEGIYLESGLYKIDYEYSLQEKSACGLGTFEPDTKQCKKILTYHIPAGEVSTNIQYRGSTFVKVEEAEILGIINNKRKIDPDSQRGLCFITLRKLIKSTLP